ncbi:hypothetical protein MHU86_13232 [Fragilaria crotonensis]|nr:hypothetical protein MHU86_13232 [Fragilaria crotonensis]
MAYAHRIVLFCTTLLGTSRADTAINNSRQRAPRLLVGEEALKQRKFGDRWRKALVSKRVAADLRKEAVRTGTFGSFDASTGIGWDPLWDNPGRMPSLRPPKDSKRNISREMRAVKIETKLEGMEEQILAYRKVLKDRKPEQTFETYYKNLMRVKKR